MKTLKKLFLALSLVLASAGMAHAQGAGALCQTTLSATVPVCPLIMTTITQAVGAGTNPISGNTTAYQNYVVLGSVTGVVAPVNNVPQTYIYIDNELMAVNGTPNTTTLVVPVQRGFSGTAAAAHASGQMVLLGAPFQFYFQDPNGACTNTAIQSTPYLNVVNGNQWLCSSVTGTWVPGFGNPGTGAQPISFTTTVGSAASTANTPSGPLFQISGTNAMTGFTVPVGCNATPQGSCSFTVIPSGVFTWTAANNITPASATLLTGSSAYLVVAGQGIKFVWNPVTSKFNPVL